MEKTNIKKLAVAGMLIALGVALSPLSIPIGAARCFPVQHVINVLGGIFLGPWYNVGMAFVTSLIRVSMGTGSLLAFPGSMCGALLCGLVFLATKKVWAAALGEVIGTGILGGLLAFPIATLFMGKQVAVFAFVVPFLVSTIGGSAIACLIIAALKRTHAMKKMSEVLTS